jgi:hypothetical protein
MGFFGILTAAGYTLFEAARVQADRFNGLIDVSEAHSRHAANPSGRRESVVPWLNTRILALTNQEAESIPDTIERIHEVDGRLLAMRTGGHIPPDVSNHYSALTTEELKQAAQGLAAGARRVVDAASFRLTQVNFDHLRKALPWVGAVLAIGATLFAGAVAYDKGQPSEAIAVSETTAVEAHFSDPERIDGLVADSEQATNCETMAGFLVGGTWAEPRVVTVAEPGCNSVTTDEAVVTPTTPARPAPFETPIPVLVYATGSEAAPCNGWAVDGTWEDPTVLVPAGEPCGTSGVLEADRAKWLVVPADGSER